jgi:6-phosphofructokinase 1
VILAEGAHDRTGITSAVPTCSALEEQLGEDVRVTVLGHVQRGGRPSAFDRTLGTLMGHEAVRTILAATPDDEPVVIGIKNNRMTRIPLMERYREDAGSGRGNRRQDYERP